MTNVYGRVTLFQIASREFCILTTQGQIVQHSFVCILSLTQANDAYSFNKSQ